MNLRDELNAVTPRLRRYARALVTGSPAPNEVADDLVHATLKRALGVRFLGGAEDLTIRCYATITQLHRERSVGSRLSAAADARRPALVAGGVRQAKLSAGLLSLPLEDREALLLVVLEGFGHVEAARILRISRSALISRLAQARTALDQCLRARPVTRVRARTAPYLRLVT